MRGQALAALETGARAILGRRLTDPETDQLDKYLKLLLKWQRSQRLVGRADPSWIVEHLILDSLLFLRVLPGEFRTVLDLGSGAGFPGIPLKIVRSTTSLTLVESRRKRASFLAAVVRELGLDDVRVINARIEDVIGELAARFDAVVMRCAGQPNDLAAVARPLLAARGLLVASGPPHEATRRAEDAPLHGGEWVTVQGPHPGSRRRFAVYRA
jgi:16S rRNA (guanine527-N7)-methyltransferase